MTFDDCRYVALVTIERMIAFVFQPLVGVLRGQPVEQFRMARRLSLGAEIVDRFHQPRTEQHLPIAVHRHAGRQRIGRIDKPAGQAQAVVGRAGRKGGKLAGTPGATLSPRLSYSPRTRMNVSRGVGISCITIVVGKLSTSAPPFAELDDVPPCLANRLRGRLGEEVAAELSCLCRRAPLGRG